MSIDEYCPPVAIFVYKNLETTRAVVAALLENKESADTKLIFFSDGPKSETERSEVEEVRNFCSSVSGFESVDIIHRASNLGLAESFITGITETLDAYPSAIFLEDDNLVSPFFLSFMRSALEQFAEEPRVICISGFSYPQIPSPKAPYFLLGAETWSMGTWRRGWHQFEENAEFLLDEIDRLRLRRKLNLYGFDFYRMLRSQVNGEIDSWGVRWWASAVYQEKYCLFPAEPHCVSIGDKADAVHARGYNPLMRQERDLAKALTLRLPDNPRLSLREILTIRAANLIMVLTRYRRKPWLLFPPKWYRRRG